MASGDRLALVWPGSDRGASARKVAEGARARATERGYGLEEFRLAAYGKHPARLGDVIAARGIVVAAFGPSFGGAVVVPGWPWERFAMAMIGSADWGVPLSRAAHHHFEAMRLAPGALIQAGARRPAALLDEATNERAHRGWQAAWLAYAGPGAAARVRLLAKAEDATAWLRARSADAVVGDDAARLEALGADCPAVAVTLARDAADRWAGVAQGSDVIAGHAVDLVIAQLHRNERGLPKTPRSLLFAGRREEPSPTGVVAPG